MQLLPRPSVRYHASLWHKPQGPARRFVAHRITAVVLIALCGWLACTGSIATAQVTPGYKLNYNAGADDGVNNVWEQDGTAIGGFDISGLTNYAHSLFPITSLPGITGAYTFTGGGGTLPTLEGQFDENNLGVTFEMWFRPSDLAGDERLFETGGGNGVGITMGGGSQEAATPDSHVFFSVTQNSGGDQTARVSHDLTSVALGEFIQVVGVFDIDTDTSDLYVNGQWVGSATSAGNITDWSGGDGASVGRLGGSNQGGYTGGGAGFVDYSGEIAIFRVYEATLSASEVTANFAAVAGTDVVFDDDSTDGTWQNGLNWNTNIEPASSQTVHVGNGLTATVTELGEVADGLVLGEGAPATGTVNINSGSLTVTGDIATLGTGVVNLNGGLLVLPGTTASRQVTDYTHADGATLRVGILDGVLTALDVTGTATLASTGTSLFEFEVGGGASTSETVTWDAAAGTWDVASNWDPDVLPSQGSGAVLPGTTFPLLTAGTLVNEANVAAADPGWQVTADGNTLKVTKTGDPIGAGPAKAVIDTAGADVTSNGNLRIALEAGADAAGLQIDAGKLTFSGSNELIMGGGAAGTVDQNGGEVTIGGNLRFGPSDNSLGGTYNLNDGTLHVMGSVVETNGGVDLAQLHINGGTLQVDGIITVQRFSVAEAAGSDTSYEIAGGQSVTSTGTTVAGSSGKGTITLSDGSLKSSNAYVGESGGSEGLVVITGGNTWTVDQFLKIGNNGTGGVVLEDGTLRITGSGQGNSANRALRMAEGASSTATFIMGKGDGSTSPVLTINNSSNGSNWETANAGTGITIIWSGTASLHHDNFITGQAVGSVANVQVGGGAGTATLNLDQGDGNRDWNTNGGHGIVSVLQNGVVNLGRDLNLGSNSDADSGLELTIDGGAVNLGTQQSPDRGGNINFRPGGPKDRIDIVSGSLSTGGGDVNFDNASDRINLSGGTLDMGGGNILLTETDGSQLSFTGGRLQNLGVLKSALLATPDISGTGTAQDGILASVEPTASMSQANLVGGKLDGAIDFDGDNDYLDFGSGTVMNDPPSAFTLAMWFNRNSQVDSATNHGTNNVLAAVSRTNDNDNFEIGSEGTNVEVYIDAAGDIEPNKSGATDGRFDTSGVDGGIADDQWHHVVLAYDNSRAEGEKLQIYFDGTKFVTKGTPPNGTLAGAPSELTVGIARIDAGEKWGDFDGQIDDFSLWGRALTDDEVARLYNGGDGAALGTLIADLVDPFSTTALDIYAPMDEVEVAESVQLVQQGGTVAPGDRIGMTSVLGGYDMQAGQLEIQINGYDQGDRGWAGDAAGNDVGHDFVELAEDALLNGQVLVELLDGFVPQTGDAFDVLHAANVTLGEDFGLVQPDGLLPAQYFLAAVIGASGDQYLELRVGVPEPSSVLLAALGLAALALYGCRRRR